MLHGYCPPARFLPYLSWTQIAALPDKANIVIVLPAGSTEQHARFGRNVGVAPDDERTRRVDGDHARQEDEVPGAAPS